MGGVGAPGAVVWGRYARARSRLSCPLDSDGVAEGDVGVVDTSWGDGPEEGGGGGEVVQGT